MSDRRWFGWYSDQWVNYSPPTINSEMRIAPLLVLQITGLAPVDSLVRQFDTMDGEIETAVVTVKCILPRLACQILVSNWPGSSA